MKQVIHDEGSRPIKIWTNDVDAVMANQTDLVDVVHTLKQVLCIKGN